MSVVPLQKRHIDHRGDHMSIIRNLKLGNTTVLISDEYLPRSEQQRQSVEQNMVDAMWTWWDSLSVEEQIAYNESIEQEGA